jgi:hypothetical protein
VHATGDGTLTSAAGPIDGPVLVDRDSTWASFADARLVRRSAGGIVAPFDLWAPTGAHVRLAAEVVGLRFDDWLARTGWVTVWPSQVARRLTLRISLPDPRAATDTIHFSGASSRSLAVQPTQTRTVTFLIPAGTRPWTVHWFCDRYGYRNGTPVSFVSGPPRITAASGPLR